MDKYTQLVTDNDFSKFTLNVTKYPKSLKHWEILINFLITKASPINKAIEHQVYELICSTYSSMLLNFPYLENYHIDYALFEYKLGNVKKVHSIFQKALGCLNKKSLLIWISYLRICNEIIIDNKKLFQKYEEAESFIGLHFLSSEFWKLYLSQLELRCKDNSKYIKVLRKILEIPLYDFSEFYALWLRQIDSIKDLKELTKFVSKEDLTNKLKIDLKFIGQRGPYLKENKKLLKKFTKELYMVIQFQVLEIYSFFESKIQTQYYSSTETLIPLDELETWDNYLDYTINLNIDSLTHLNFQRALIPTKHYDTFYIKYSMWLIDNKSDLFTAKNILLQGLKYSLKKTNILKILYPLLIQLTEFDQLNNLLLELNKSFNENIEATKDFEIFWDFVQYNVFLRKSVPPSRYSSTSTHAKQSISLPVDIFEKIRARLDYGNEMKGQEVILSSLIQLQSKDNTSQIEEQIFNYLRVDCPTRNFYINNGEYWKFYCHLIFFDPSKSYIEKRQKIVNEIWKSIPKNQNSADNILPYLLEFSETYLPEDIDTLYDILSVDTK